MDIKHIIKAQRLKKNLTMKELSEKIGVSEGTISRWESGEIENMRRSAIVSLCKVLDIKPSVIMGWENVEEKALPVVYYDYAPVSISAGDLNFIEPLEKFEKLEVPNVILGKYAKDKNILFMHVNGESMNKIIDNGSLIAVKRNVSYNSIKDNDIVVIATDEGYSVKRYYNDKENQRFIFRPDSNDLSFLPIIKSYDDDVQLIGRVVMYNVII